MSEMGQGVRILVVDDVSTHAELLVDELLDHGFEAKAARGGEAALLALDRSADERRDYALVVSDLRMPGLDGFELLSAIQRRATERNEMPPGVILLTGFGTVDQAVKAIKAGADDFLTKPVNLEHFVLTVGRVLELRGLRRAAFLRGEQDFHGMAGTSAPMKQLFETLVRTADGEGAVLIEGESGTGKELVARALHDESRRRSGPFVAINCGGIPESLLESELFGHVAGAFSGARGARRGLFASADGGTLFLDEIGELPVSMQAKLLRVLQDGGVRPVGADRETQVDVRIVAATHQDLRAAQAAGLFREDLYYRLQTFRLRVPPLRERGNDVLSLFERFVREFAAQRQPPIEGVASEALRACLHYAWPGNVRELRSVAERVATLAPGHRVEWTDLPEEIRVAAVDGAPQSAGVGACRLGPAQQNRPLAESGESQHKSDPPIDVPLAGSSKLNEREDRPLDVPRLTLEAIERRHVEAVLEATAGNRTRAAEWLGIGRKTLYRRLRRWGLDES
ncbi:MAG: sigma-54-dependent transcriptional regulator [Thioalkalivibrionaceae bacterium]